jgi:hypothetical protein
MDWCGLIVLSKMGEETEADRLRLLEDYIAGD